jgi:hypothetical protein
MNGEHREDGTKRLGPLSPGAPPGNEKADASVDQAAQGEIGRIPDSMGSVSCGSAQSTESYPREA